MWMSEDRRNTWCSTTNDVGIEFRKIASGKDGGEKQS